MIDLEIFADLTREIKKCELCPRMDNRSRVFGIECGNVNSQILFIAEAPGRLGADIFGIPLWGDQTGKNFEALLHSIGWHRGMMFVTNAVLCNPRDESGNNAPPNKEEMLNCSSHLEILIDVMKPKLIVTLGQKALDGLGNIESIKIKLKDHVAVPFKWRGIHIFPLYHPGPRALLHRSKSKQLMDYFNLHLFANEVIGVEQIRSNTLPISHAKMFQPNKLQMLLKFLVDRNGSITYTALREIIFRLDIECLKERGRFLTETIYHRESKNRIFPFSWEQDLRKLDGFEVICRSKHVKVGNNCRFSPAFNKNEMDFMYKTLISIEGGILKDTPDKLWEYMIQKGERRYIDNIGHSQLTLL